MYKLNFIYFPYSEDPELGNSTTEETGNVTRISTRQWVMDQNYNAKAIFTKLFHDDIKLLLSMDKLWEKKERKKPTPLGNVRLWKLK